MPPAPPSNSLHKDLLSGTANGYQKDFLFKKLDNFTSRPTMIGNPSKSLNSNFGGKIFEFSRHKSIFEMTRLKTLKRNYPYFSPMCENLFSVYSFANQFLDGTLVGF